jgi:uncharacterized protein (DUF1330 family)
MSINHAALDAAFETYDPKKPITMMLLAKFRETADYAPYLNEHVSVDSSPCTGREAMARASPSFLLLLPPSPQISILSFILLALPRHLANTSTGYRTLITPLIPPHAQMLFFSRVVATLIAPAGETWDEVVLVKYEDLAGFRKTVQSEEYKRGIEVHRFAALEDSRLVLVEEVAV